MKRIINAFVNLFKSCQDVWYIYGPDTLPAPLNSDYEKEMLLKCESGCIESRNILIEHNLRLVVYIAKKYDNNSSYMEDLISIGTIGLIKGINTFKLDKNIKLATYASRCIENEILMFLRKRSNQKLEISFDEPLNIDYDGNELLLSDVLGTPDDTITKQIEKEEQKEELKRAMHFLNEREKEIMVLRFGLDNGIEWTQKDVALYLGISQSYISRLEKRIMKKLKMQLNN